VAQIFSLAVLGGFVLYMPGEWNAMRWIGICIAVPAGLLLLTARYQLGTSFSVSAQARQLVTRGIYSKIRNPIYFFGNLLLIGFLLVLQKPAAWLLLLIVVPMQIWRARNEARVLEETFGDEYREYRRKVWF
jgi:protein-S-isoprenylcysteine O-methyltransferase Ste14